MKLIDCAGKKIAFELSPACCRPALNDVKGSPAIDETFLSLHIYTALESRKAIMQRITCESAPTFSQMKINLRTTMAVLAHGCNLHISFGYNKCKT